MPMDDALVQLVAATRPQASTRHDVKPVNRSEDRSLYAKREKIYPKLAHGTLPHLQVAGDGRHARHLLRRCRGCAGIAGPTCPTRPCCSTWRTTASSSSFSRSGRRNSTSSPACWCWRRSALFLVTSVAGRAWCGYTCPQTVWTDLMIVVERFWQGDRNARIRLDKAPLGRRQDLREGA